MLFAFQAEQPPCKKKSNYKREHGFKSKFELDDVIILFREIINFWQFVESSWT